MLRRAWIRNSLIGLVGFLVLFGALGYWVAPGLIQRAAQEKLSTLLGRATTIGAVSVRPFSLAVKIADFRIAKASGAGALLEIAEIDAGLSLATLYRFAPVINRLHVTAPHIAIERLGPQRFDFSDILDRLAASATKADAPPKSEAKAAFSINNIEISDGLVTFDDDVTHSRHRLDGITLNLPFISTIRHDVELYVEPAFSAKLDGSPLALKGKSRPFEESLETALNLQVEALDLPNYVSFAPLTLRPKLASGLLSTNLQIAFRRDPNGSPHIVLSGQATLDKLRVLKPDEVEALSAKRIALDLKSLDLLAAAVEVNSLEIEAPTVSASRAADGRIDLVDVLSGPDATSAAPARAATQAAPSGAPSGGPATAPPPAAPRLWLGLLKLTDGTLHFQDHSTAKPVALDLTDIHAQVNDLSNEPGKLTHFALGLSTAPNQTLGFDGQSTLNDKKLSGHFVVSDVHLVGLAPFAAGVLAARIEDGALEGAGDIDLDWTTAEPQVKIGKLALALNHLRVARTGERVPVLAADRIALENGSVDLTGRSVQIGRVALTGVKANVSRDAQGVLNLTTLAGGAKQTPAPSAHAGAHAPEPPGFQVALAQLDVESSELGLADASVTPALDLHLEKISLTARELKLAPGAKIPFQFAAEANHKGHLEIKGEVTASPLAVTADISSRAVPLAPLQGYLGNRLNVAISQADLSVRGALKLVMAPAPDVRFNGTVELSDFSSLDKVTGAEFLRWKSLRVPNIDAHLPGGALPVSVQLGDIVLSQFYSRLIVYPDGRLNVQDIVAQPGRTAPQSITSANSEPQAEPGPAAGDIQGAPPAPGSATAARGQAPIIRLKSVKLDAGEINFTDNFVRPNYTTNITGLSGAVSAVASDNPRPADVSLKGSLEGNGDLSVTGTINPLAKPLFLDLVAAATSIELTRLTPYAAKYAGYNIEKGKLSMKVKYHIENNQLEAQNNLFLDQLTFGERVESPTATKLPVLLAISLLKDTHGQININLPVSGSLSDPQFSIGGVIVRVIVNLLEKALLSPFQLLASVGGGDSAELGYVEFAPGGAELTPAAKAKLAKLVGLLAERPALSLEITGRADSATDTGAARDARLAAKVRGLKYRELLGTGQTVAFEDVSVSAAEYPKYLELVYKEAEFEKPRNVVGLAKSLSVPEMEQLLRANMPVNDDDLLALADRRALAVRDALAQSGKIEPARVFMVAPRLMSAAPEDKGSPNRVDFALH